MCPLQTEKLLSQYSGGTAIPVRSCFPSNFTLLPFYLMLNVSTDNSILSSTTKTLGTQTYLSGL